MTAKPLLRRFIVATSVPPFAALYRAVYRALIRLAVLRLRGVPGLRAVYLRRGLAVGPGVPGISDIDLAAVGDWDRGQQSRVEESYRRLARAVPIYDPGLRVYTPQSLAPEAQDDPFLRHRVSEGPAQWKLLYGENCLKHVPAISAEDEAVGCESEFRYWWLHFAEEVIGGRSAGDSVFVNSLCYKVVAECIRADRALRGLPVPGSREAALERGESAFFTRLKESAGRRHLRYRGDVAEETLEFLLPFYDATFANLRSHPAWSARAAVRTDSPPAEHVAAKVAFDVDWARVSFVAGSTFAMDELILLCEPANSTLPDLVTLQATARKCAETFRDSRSRVSAYLRLPSVALQFYVSDHYRDWQVLLWPEANPDIFPNMNAGWTRPAAAFIHRERRLLAEGLDDPATYKANNLDFLRMLWTFLALVVAEHSAARGQAILAHSPEAVLRAFDCMKVRQPAFLASFADAYRSELAGRPAAIGRDLPAAIAFLKSLQNGL